MKTIILQEPGHLLLTDTPAPVPAEGEALVRVRCAGVCGTDLHAFRGSQPFFTYPRIPGHELGVEVLEVRSAADDVRPGDRCAVEPYLECGRCVACRHGRPNACVHLRVLGVHVDGGMREQITVPVRKLHRTGRLGYEQLALVETLSIGAHAVARAALEPGEWTLVIGAGPIGLSAIQFARQAGARVAVMDVSEPRLEFCRRHLQVEHTIHGGGDPRETASLLTDGELFTAVFDATGNPASMMRSFQLVAHGGRLVFVGLFQGDVTFHDPDFHRREMTLLASRNSVAADFTRIIGLVESGAVDTTPWISPPVPALEAIDRFPQWTSPDAGVLKAMIAF